MHLWSLMINSDPPWSVWRVTSGVPAPRSCRGWSRTSSQTRSGSWTLWKRSSGRGRGSWCTEAGNRGERMLCHRPLFLLSLCLCVCLCSLKHTLHNRKTQQRPRRWTTKQSTSSNPPIWTPNSAVSWSKHKHAAVIETPPSHHVLLSSTWNTQHHRNMNSCAQQLHFLSFPLSLVRFPITLKNDGL